MAKRKKASKVQSRAKLRKRNSAKRGKARKVAGSVRGKATKRAVASAKPKSAPVKKAALKEMAPAIEGIAVESVESVAVKPVEQPAPGTV